MPEARLFVSDVDGTLVDRKGRLRDDARARLTKLLEQGLPFTVASARSAYSLRVMLEGLPLNLPVIEFNGAFLTELATGRRAFVRAIEPAVASHVCDMGRAHGLVPFVSAFDGSRDRLYAGAARNGGMQWYIEERRSFRDPRLELVDDPSAGLVHQVVCLTFIAREYELAPFAAELERVHRGQIRTQLYENAYSPGWHWLSVHDQRATKAIALRELCETIAVPLANLTVFGDERNDIPMFEIAGRSVAVANAHPDVRACAHELIGDHETDSVVSYLERHFAGAVT